MKPLINTIPKKIVSILGKEYTIYACITVTETTVRGKYKSVIFHTVCTASGKHKSFSVSHGRIEKIGVGVLKETLDKISEIVEANYSQKHGLKLSDLQPKHSLGTYTHPNSVSYTAVKYAVYQFPQGTAQFISKLIGRTKIITQLDIDTRVKEANKHQLIANTEYNRQAKQYNTLLAETIRAEVEQRDKVYFQKK